MTDWISVTISVGLVLMVVLLLLACWLILGSERKATERILGLEMVAALLIGVVILAALNERTDTLLDVGIVLAALGFAGTVSIARYISEGRLF